MREMKDSGISWIDKMPESWNAEPIKYNYSLIAGATPESTNIDFWDGDIKWITPADFKTKDIFVSGGSRNLTVEGYKSCSTSMLPIGSIVFSKRAPIGTAALTTEKLCTNQGCLGLVEKNERVLNKFYFYVISIYGDVFNLYGSGTTFKEISANTFANIKLPTPPLTEQKRIVDFLDAKCTEIDALTADIQAQIDTLEQYKRSVITEAVTKGLNPDVEMKDSGARWSPLIPVHWTQMPAKYLFHNSDLRRQSGDEQLTASQKYGIITQQAYMELENASIVLANKGVENWKHVEPNDFIISLRSFQGGLEMSKITGCITWHYVVLKASQNICHQYYKWLFKSAQYINALQGTCNFIRDGQDLRFSNFAQVPLLAPPIEEQETIADYLTQKTSEIDAIITAKKEQLSTLAEYKKSLIYEYVTGKKEVPANA